MFEIARIALERQAGTKVVAGWMSPVSDGYRKKGLGKNDLNFRIFLNFFHSFAKKIMIIFSSFGRT